MKINPLFIGLMAVLLLTGCGSLTKMRYSRGLKSNIEFNFRNKKGSKEEFAAQWAVKQKHKQKVFKDTAIKSAQVEQLETPKMLSVTKEINNKSYIFFNEKLLPVSNHFIFKNKKEELFEDDPKPLEPHSKSAGILFYFGLLLLFFSWVLFYIFVVSLLPVPVFIIVMAILSVLLILTGFMLALISQKIIRHYDEFWKGSTLNLSILFITFIAFTLLLLLSSLSWLLIFLLMLLFISFMILYVAY